MTQVRLTLVIQELDNSVISDILLDALDDVKSAVEGEYTTPNT
jgi:hypothetical protein